MKEGIVMIRFRPMKIGDTARIAELEKICFAVPWSELSFREEIKNPCAYYTVAEDSGKVVGYGGIWNVFDESYITNIAVDPKYRQTGVGRAVLNKLLQEAKRKGAQLVTLEVRPSNVPAMSLYESEGFVQLGLRKAYYPDNGEDALVMMKKFQTD